MNGKASWDVLVAKVASAIALVNALLLVLVALVQFVSGETTMVVAGLINSGAAVAYFYIAYGVLFGRSWSYRQGLRLGFLNIGWMLFQIYLGQALLPEFGIEDLTIPILFLVGDAAMVAAIFASRGALVPPSAPSLVLAAILEDAVRHGEISESEKDTVLSIRNEFAASLARKRTLLVDLDETVQGKRVDIRAASIGTLIPGVQFGKETYYAFLPIATSNTIDSYRSISGGVAEAGCVIAVDASDEALEQATHIPKRLRKLIEPDPHFTLYSLRGGCRGTTRKGSDEFSRFMRANHGTMFRDWQEVPPLTARGP